MRTSPPVAPGARTRPRLDRGADGPGSQPRQQKKPRGGRRGQLSLLSTRSRTGPQLRPDPLVRRRPPEPRVLLLVLICRHVRTVPHVRTLPRAARTCPAPVRPTAPQPPHGRPPQRRRRPVPQLLPLRGRPRRLRRVHRRGPAPSTGRQRRRPASLPRRRSGSLRIRRPSPGRRRLSARRLGQRSRRPLLMHQRPGSIRLSPRRPGPAAPLRVRRRPPPRRRRAVQRRQLGLRPRPCRPRRPELSGGRRNQHRLLPAGRCPRLRRRRRLRRRPPAPRPPLVTAQHQRVLRPPASPRAEVRPAPAPLRSRWCRGLPAITSRTAS